MGKSVYLHINNYHADNEIRKIIPLTISSKISWNKAKQRGKRLLQYEFASLKTETEGNTAEGKTSTAVQ